MKKIFILAIVFAMTLTSCMSDYTKEKAEERAEKLLVVEYYGNQQRMIDNMFDTMKIMVSQDVRINDYVISYDTIFLGYYNHYEDNPSVVKLKIWNCREGYYLIDTVTLGEYINECEHDYFLKRLNIGVDEMFILVYPRDREKLINKCYHEADSIRDMVLAHDGSIKAFDRYVDKLLHSETFRSKYSYRFEKLPYYDLPTTNRLEQEIDDNISHLDSIITLINAGEKVEKRDFVWNGKEHVWEGEINIDTWL